MSGLIDYGWLSDVDWPESPGTSLQFDLPGQHKLLWQLGVRALWEVATKCPCGQSSGDSAPLPDCPVCSGYGWEFHHPQIVRLVAIGFGKNLMPFERWGSWEPGQLSFTVRAEHCPAAMDRITLLDARMPINDMFIRKAGVGEYETLRFPIVQKPILRGSDLGTTLLDVVHIRPGGDDGMPKAALVAGSDFEVHYTDLPADYDAAATGQIDWALGDAKAIPTTPDVGALFSCYYYTRPVFRVMGYPHTVRDSRVVTKSPEEESLPLPVQFTAKLELAMEGA